MAIKDVDGSEIKIGDRVIQINAYDAASGALLGHSRMGGEVVDLARTRAVVKFDEQIGSREHYSVRPEFLRVVPEGAVPSPGVPMGWMANRPY